MKAVRRILTIASYAALVTGLTLTGKLTPSESTASVPLEPASIEISGDPFETEAGATGSAPLALAIETAGRSPEEITIWLEEMRKTAPPVTVDIRVGLGGAAPETVATFSSESFEPVDSVKREDEEFLIVARTDCEVEEGAKIVIEARLSGDRDDFDAFDTRLLVGSHEDAVIKRARRDKTPGVVLLAGLGGVFLHLFMAWSRLVVPMREALPPEPELEP